MNEQPHTRGIDPEDAGPILKEWMEFLATAIQTGMVEVGGEISTELTSGVGQDYAVAVTSQRSSGGTVELTGQIRRTTSSGPEIKMHGEVDLPDQP